MKCPICERASLAWDEERYFCRYCKILFTEEEAKKIRDMDREAKENRKRESVRALKELREKIMDK